MTVYSPSRKSYWACSHTVRDLLWLPSVMGCLGSRWNLKQLWRELFFFYLFFCLPLSEQSMFESCAERWHIHVSHKCQRECLFFFSSQWIWHTDRYINRDNSFASFTFLLVLAEHLAAPDSSICRRVFTKTHKKLSDVALSSQTKWGWKNPLSVVGYTQSAKHVLDSCC